MVRLVMEADIRSLEREHNNRAWLAHTAAALQRAKRLPRLESLLAKRRRRKPQTWQEQLATARMITAAYNRHDRQKRP